MHKISGMIVTYIVGGDWSKIMDNLKFIWKDCEYSEPDFIYPRYPRGSNKDDPRILPIELPDSIWLENSHHHKKVSKDNIFSKSEVSKKANPHSIYKVEYTEINKYCRYSEKHNRSESIRYFIKAMCDPLEHLFNNQLFCGEWCMCKKELANIKNKLDSNKSNNTKSNKISGKEENINKPTTFFYCNNWAKFTYEVIKNLLEPYMKRY